MARKTFDDLYKSAVANRDNRQKSLESDRRRIVAQIEALPYQQEASRSFAGRFGEALGRNAAEIPRGLVRGFVGGTQYLTSPIRNARAGRGFTFSDDTITPSNKVAKFLAGEQPFNVASEGGGFMDLFGATEATKEKYALPVGLILAGSDFVPIPKASLAKQLNRASKTISATDDVAKISRELSRFMRADSQKINALAARLSSMTDEVEVNRLLTDITKPVTELDYRSVAQNIRDRGMGRSEFVRKFKESIKQNTPEGKRNMQFDLKLKKEGLTPESFYDNFVKRDPNQKPPRLDSVGKRVTNQAADRVITRKESTLLKDRLRVISREARAAQTLARQAGRSAKTITKRKIKQYQTEFTNMMKTSLPPAMRGKVDKLIKNINSPATLNKAAERLRQVIDDYDELRRLSKLQGQKRSQLAFIKKLGSFNQTFTNKIKSDLGINKPVRKMNLAELTAVVEEAKKRLKFAEGSRFFQKKQLVNGKFVDKPRPKRATTEADYQEYARVQAENRGYLARVRRGWENFKESFNNLDLVNIPSESLRAMGADELGTQLRRMQFNARMKTKEMSDVMDTLYTKLGFGRVKGPLINKEDLATLDLAMKNGENAKVLEIAKKYGVEDEFRKIRTLLDEIFERANDTGLEVIYRKGFWPRMAKQDPASQKRLLAMFDREYGDDMAELAEKFRAQNGKLPSDLERWKMINSLYSGFAPQGIALSKTGSLKRRTIETLNPAAADLYENSLGSIINYTESVNNLIEARRFFGRHLPKDSKALNSELQFGADYATVAGKVINDMVIEGKVKSADYERLKKVLKARFTGGQMSPWLKTWKSFSYVSLMGDIFSALTQVQDFEKVMFRSGARSGAPAVFKAIFNPTKQDLRLGDLGLDKTISAEMGASDFMDRVVNQTFKKAGLTWTDRLGKESFISGVISRYKRAYKSGDERFLSRARKIFGDETNQVLDDLSAGNYTDNVKFLIANEVEDFFPVSLSEVPIQYLRSPGARIFYVMKTFTTKQLNTYRREIFREWNQGSKLQAAKNAASLTGWFLFLGATVDEVKDFVRRPEDNEIELSDKMVDNLLKMTGFSRYALGQTQREGFVRSALEATVLPPSTFVDDAYLDFQDFLSGDEFKARSTRNVPLGGELYYWWFGRGQDVLDRQRGSSGGSREVQRRTVAPGRTVQRREVKD